MWERSARRLVEGVVRRAGRLAARAATREMARENLAWVQDTLLVGMSDELDRLGVPRAVAADMFNVSTRTYRRHLHAARSTSAPPGSVWSLLMRRLAEPTPRDAILSWFPASMDEAVTTLLHDMHRAGWLVRDGATYCLRERAASWSDEMVIQYVSLERAMGDEVTPDELASLTGRELERCEALVERAREQVMGTIRTSSAPSRDLVTSLVFEHVFDVCEGEEGAELTHHVLRFGDEDAARVEQLMAELAELTERASARVDACRAQRGEGRTRELRVTIAFDAPE